MLESNKIDQAENALDSVLLYVKISHLPVSKVDVVSLVTRRLSFLPFGGRHGIV